MRLELRVCSQEEDRENFPFLEGCHKDMYYCAHHNMFTCSFHLCGPKGEQEDRCEFIFADVNL